MTRTLRILPMLFAVLLYGTGAGLSLHVQAFHAPGGLTPCGSHVHPSCGEHRTHSHDERDHSGAPGGESDSEHPEGPLDHDCATCQMLGGLAAVAIAHAESTGQFVCFEAAFAVADVAASTNAVRLDGARAPPSAHS